MKVMVELVGCIDPPRQHRRDPGASGSVSVMFGRPDKFEDMVERLDYAA